MAPKARLLSRRVAGAVLWAWAMGPASPAGVAQVVPGGLGTRVNGTALGRCGNGVCSVQGGSTVGRTLYHRFSQFDTRNGIRRVDLDTRGRSSVVVGVSHPDGTFFGAPLRLSEAASLFWLSPGGIWLGTGGQILGATNLLLSTAPTLRLPGGEFTALGGLGDGAGRLGDASGLDLASLASGTGTGPIVLAGGRLQVDRHLLLDSGAGPIVSLPGRRHALQAGGDVVLGGGDLVLNGLDVQAGTAAAGRLWLRSASRAGGGQGRLELADSALRGSRLALEGASVRLDGVRLEGGDVLVRAGGPLSASRLRARATAAESGTAGTLWLEAGSALRLDGANLAGRQVEIQADGPIAWRQGHARASGNGEGGDLRLLTRPGPGRAASALALEGVGLSGARVSLEAAGQLASRDLVVEGGTIRARADQRLSLEGSQLRATGEGGRIQLEALSPPGGPPGGRLDLRGSHLSGPTIVGRADQAITLREVSAVAGEPGRRGLIQLETAPAAASPAGPGASGETTLTATRLEGGRVQVRGGTVQVSGSQVVAPKGLVLLEATSGDLGIAASRLDVGVATEADLRADLPRFLIPSDAGAQVDITVSSTPSIGLFAAGALTIRDGSAVLASQDVDAFRQANPALRRDDIRLADTSGLVVANGEKGLRVGDSRIAADATDNLAGTVILRSGAGETTRPLALVNTRLSASGGAGSGDIRLNSASGLLLQGSQLEALSRRFREADGQPDPALGFSGGELTLTNSSTTRPIQIVESRLNATQALEGPPLPATSLRPDANNVSFADPYDDFDNFDVYTGGHITLLSAGGLHLSGAQTHLSVGEADPIPTTTTIAGTIRLANLSSRPLRIDKGAQLSAITRSPADGRGTINLWSRGPIQIHGATLDASTSTGAPGHHTSLSLLSGASTSLRDSALRHADPRGANRIRLESRGPSTVVNTTFSSPCPGPSCQQAPWSAARSQRFLNNGFWGPQGPNDYLSLEGNRIQDQVVSGGDFFPDGGLVGQTRARLTREPQKLLFLDGAPPLSLEQQTPVAGRRPPGASADPTPDLSTPLSPPWRDFPLPWLRDPAIAAGRLARGELSLAPPAGTPATLALASSAVRALPTPEARQIVLDAQREASRHVQAALGLTDRAPAARDVASLQAALRGALPREAPASARPYRPAILQISVTALPEGSGMQINQILIPAAGAIQGWQSSVDGQALKGAIQHVQRQFSALAASDAGGVADQLSALLLEPVLPALRDQGVTALLLSLDRGLQGVPFAALPVAGGTLGDQVALTVTPALALTDLHPQPPTSPGRALLAGASAFGNGLAPLPMARQELRQLATLLPDPLLLMDRQFQTRSLIEATLAHPISVLHMATHADFSDTRGSGARIYTSDGDVSLLDLGRRRRQAASPAMSLFVLNACRTALGNEERELGIAGLALQAGASTALGNLWYVDDVVTAAFSIQFHRWLQSGLRKDQALQATQRQFRRGEIRVAGDQILGGTDVLITGLSRSQQIQLANTLHHPYYWAGAVLSGSPW